MIPWRALGAVIAVAFLSLRVTTCRSPGEGGRGPEPGKEEAVVVELPGVDSASLTAREKREWSSAVSELLAPCPDQPVSLAQCVKESRDCRACKPAAEFLVKQVRRGRTRSQMEAAFKKRFAADQIKQVPITGAPHKGAAGASIVVVEWADFECPFCARTAPVLDALLERFPGHVQLVFKHYPLSGHKHAEKAARAAVAAGKQGKFWEMHKALFAAHPKPLDPPTIESIAEEIGLDMKKFRDDLDSEAVADAVAKDRKQGDDLDLSGTPMVYINGRHFDLDHFEIGEDLEDWVKLEIEMKTGKKVSPTGSKAPPPPSGKPDSAERVAKPTPSAAPKVDVPAPKKAPPGSETTK